MRDGGNIGGEEEEDRRQESSEDEVKGSTISVPVLVPQSHHKHSCHHRLNRLSMIVVSARSPQVLPSRSAH